VRTPVAGLDAGARTLVLLFVSFMVGQKEGDPVYNAPLGTEWSIAVATASSEIKLIVPAAVEETLLTRSCRFFHQNKPVLNWRLSRIPLFSFSAGGLAKSLAAKPAFFLGQWPAANSAAYGYT